MTLWSLKVLTQTLKLKFIAGSRQQVTNTAVDTNKAINTVTNTAINTGSKREEITYRGLWLHMQ
jgi:hypothetical protein